MLFSKRFIFLASLGIVPIFILAVFGFGGLAFAAYNLLLLVVWMYDWYVTPPVKVLKIRRQLDNKLSMGVFNNIKLEIFNCSKYLLHIKIRDEIPHYCESDKEILSLYAVPRNHSEVCYQIKPIKRGEFSFGRVFVRMKGVLGLCVKSGSFEIEQSVKVYPNIKSLGKSSIILIRRKNYIQGLKRARLLGAGTEFESIREYHQGDDFRKINWMTSAREAKMMVNSYQPEKNQFVYIMMDTSRVMNSEINGVKKLDYAVNAAFLLADTALNEGDYIGLFAFDSEIKRLVKPGKGSNHFQIIAKSLYNIEQCLTSANYNETFGFFNQYQRRRSLVCIFTDIYNKEHAVQLIESIRLLSSKHKVIVLSIKDTNLIRFAGQKVNESEDIFTKSAALRLIRERQGITRLFNGASIPYLEGDPQNFSMEAISSYLQMKE